MGVKMDQKTYLENILSKPASANVAVYITIPGGFLSSEKNLPMNDCVNSIGHQITTLKEIITMGSQKDAAMISAELDTYARVKIEDDEGSIKTLPLSMAVGSYNGVGSSNSPQAIIDNHKIKDCNLVKDFYAEQWPALYSEFGSVGVDKLLRNKGVNSDISDFLKVPTNSLRVSPDSNSGIIEAGKSKTVIFSARDEKGLKAGLLSGSFPVVNLSYLVNKGLSKYPSLQAMIASDIGVDTAIRNEHRKEGSGILSAFKAASSLVSKELAEVTIALPWVNKNSIKKFADFEKIIYDNSHSTEKRIEWVLDQQEELGRMKSKDDLNIKDHDLQYSAGI
jgi:hypothetical protein